jgi:RNA polymerase sigma factor (sigma-70 family)
MARSNGVNVYLPRRFTPLRGQRRITASTLRQTSPPMQPGPDPSDDLLMTAYARGDVAAFERLYARHQAGLYRFVRRLLGPTLAAQADEIFQDTWLRVVNHRATWQPQGASFRTWLYTLANHRVIDVWRRSGREVSASMDNDEPWEPVTSDAAWQQWPAAATATRQDDIAFWRRAGERLLTCLEHLPLAQRSAFLLHHDDELPLAEVAKTLDVGFETAKTRLRYAMSKLRTCMGAYLSPMQEEASR